MACYSLRVSLAATLSASCALAAAALADDVSVTPYRPTVSTPAALSAPDWIEMEWGALNSHGGASPPRDSVPYAIKLAFSENWGVRIDGESWVRDMGPAGGNISGFGDTAAVLKRKFAVNDRSAFGLELGVTSPTAPAGLHTGSGKTDYGVNAIYSADLGTAFHTDINYSITRLGAALPGQSRDLALWATALSYNISERWGVAGEFSGTRQSGAAATGQFLLAATFSPFKRITWDCGLARATTAATPTWSIFAGATFLAFHL